MWITVRVYVFKPSILNTFNSWFLLSFINLEVAFSLHFSRLPVRENILTHWTRCIVFISITMIFLLNMLLYVITLQIRWVSLTSQLTFLFQISFYNSLRLFLSYWIETLRRSWNWILLTNWLVLHRRFRYRLESRLIIIHRHRCVSLGLDWLLTQ